MTQPQAKSLRFSRRRFLAVTAALCGSAALPGAHARDGFKTFTWRGVALGASSTLTLHHIDEAAARRAIAACLAEVARLEAIFSLHRPDSALCRLNATGRLDDAPLDLRLLLDEALQLAERTGGAFDPTIQPLWLAYADHFSARDAATEGPGEGQIATARALVDWRRVAIEGPRVRLLDPGMAVTLNGIAQGYITDKVGEVLRAGGLTHVLVNMGEQLALGPRWSGDAWQVGIADPATPDHVLEQVGLTGGALATSGGYGCRFDAAGRFTHLLDAGTGLPAHQAASVTVVADRATLADGLSTALAVLPASRRSGILTGSARAYVVPFARTTGNWL